MKNSRGHNRVFFPQFFDPDFTAKLAPLPGVAITSGADGRWDGTSVQDVDGTYGEYLLSKVAKVFPNLVDAALA